MSLRQLWRQRYSAFSGQIPQAGQEMPSTDDFWTRLHHERARTNRSGCEFCLVVFDQPNTKSQASLMPSFVEILVARVRTIDAIGWFDDRRIGLILPYTSPDAARHLADEMCQKIASVPLHPEWVVYTYPSVWTLPAEVSN